MKKFILALFIALPMASLADRHSKTKIKTALVRNNIYMLQGAGGNIGLFVGANNTVMIDDQFAPLTKKIRAAVAKIKKRRVRFVINTHWHGDHTGGNENFAKLNSIIVAHQNVRRRMSKEQFMEAFAKKVPAAPKQALPAVTFSKDMSFHLDGENIHVLHLPNAHTDGDSIVHFKDSNVIHAGDIFFNGKYPFIDTSSGGTIGGLIRAVEKVLSLTNSKTKIIPGHGPLASQKDLKKYLKMLRGIRSSISSMINKDMELDEIKIKKPTTPWDPRWDGGFIKSDKFVELVFQSL